MTRAKAKQLRQLIEQLAVTLGHSSRNTFGSITTRYNDINEADASN